MKSILKWHKDYSEKNRNYFKLSYYQVYWISWIKGVITGSILTYLIF